MSIGIGTSCRSWQGRPLQNLRQKPQWMMMVLKHLKKLDWNTLVHNPKALKRHNNWHYPLPVSSATCKPEMISQRQPNWCLTTYQQR